MPSRGDGARHAVTRTTESPKRTITEPPACLASLPVSNRRDWLLMEVSRMVITGAGSKDPKVHGSRTRRFPGNERSRFERVGTGDGLNRERFEPLEPLELPNYLRMFNRLMSSA